jgi:hypothetical protein
MWKRITGYILAWTAIRRMKEEGKFGTVQNYDGDIFGGVLGKD